MMHINHSMSQSFAPRGLLLSTALILGLATAVVDGATYTYPPPVDTSGSKSARRELEGARLELSKASAALSTAVLGRRKAFEAGEPWQTAQRALADARAKLDAVRDPVLKALQQKPAYRSALAAKEKLREQFDQLRAAAESDPKKLADLAGEVLVAATIVTNMERDALASEPEIAKAQQALEEVAAKVAALEKEFDASVQSDPAFTEPRQAKDAALEKVKVAQKDVSAALDQEAAAERQRQQQIAQIERQKQQDAARAARARRPPRRR